MIIRLKFLINSQNISLHIPKLQLLILLISQLLRLRIQERMFRVKEEKLLLVKITQLYQLLKFYLVIDLRIKNTNLILINMNQELNQLILNHIQQEKLVLYLLKLIILILKKKLKLKLLKCQLKLELKLLVMFG